MTKRYKVILNLWAGTCAEDEALESRIRAAFQGASLEVVRTRSAEEARREALSAGRRRFDAVVAVGGDGTHHWMLDALARCEVPLGLIPLGTANDLAAEYGIPADVEEAARVIRRGATTRIDLVRADGKAFATAGGMGLATDVALGVCAARQRSRLFAWLMRRLGGHIYALFLALRVLFGRRISYRYEVEGEDGRRRALDGYMALILNQAVIGKNFRAAPGASNRDGLFDVLLLRRGGLLPRLTLLRTLTLAMRGQHAARADVELVRARRFSISSPEEVAFFADGELVRRARDFHFDLLPRALRLIVPTGRADSLRLPQLAHPLASGSGLFAA